MQNHIKFITQNRQSKLQSEQQFNIHCMPAHYSAGDFCFNVHRPNWLAIAILYWKCSSGRMMVIHTESALNSKLSKRCSQKQTTVH